MELLNLLLLIGMGVVVGFINVNAGGGSSLPAGSPYKPGTTWA